MKNSIKNFRSWLDKQLGSLAPGSRLPTDKHLAEEFGISARTIWQCIKEYESLGKLERIRGSGTFIPGETESNSEIVPTKPSWERIADNLCTSILNGELQQGEQLPSIKYLVLQWNVSPKTVINALRDLEKRGMISRVGRGYRVGTAAFLTKHNIKKEIYLFNFNSNDFSEIFYGNQVQLAYHRMERELLLFGYTLRFENTSECENLFSEWLSKDTFPEGLIFFNTTDKKLRTIRKPLSRFLSSAKSHRAKKIPVLIDWAEDFTISFPKATDIFRREHIIIAAFMELTQFYVQRNMSNISFFIDTGSPGLFYRPQSVIWLYIKFYKEMFFRNPKSKVHCYLKIKSKNYLSRFKAQIIDGAEHYLGIKPSMLRNSISIVPEFKSQFNLCTSCDSWVFVSDIYAVSALKWAQNNNIAVPGKLSIVGLENNPRYFHYGITHCGPDWDRIGYLLAHAIIRDFPVEKSTEGYIRTWAHLLERLTS